MVSENKKLLVKSLIKDLQEYPIIGLVDMSNLPASQLQRMNAMLKAKGIRIRMARKSLMQLSLADSKRENIQHLAEMVRGMPAFIFSKNNPFELYSVIQKNKSEASAKPGQIAPHDIIAKAGPTNFAPGPIISELAAVGIKTKVEAGKLSIISDTVLVKEGQPINQKVSETLKRLDIKPMEIGLNLMAVWENGLVFGAKDLFIDEAEYSQKIAQACQWAINLAMEAAYVTSETTELLLQKAFREAKTLAIEQNIINEETQNEILAKAEAQALSIKEEGNIDAQVEPKPMEHGPVHPSFGHIKDDQTKELFEHLQKGGTLRDVNMKIKE